MKVIFLDFDGVINSFDSDVVSLECVEILKKIIDVSGAKIVVTSSNKYHVQKGYIAYERSNLYNNYIKKLASYGIEVYDYTLCINQNRELEIKQYLESHNEIEQFLILDDDYFFKEYNGHQIFIDLGIGLGLEHYDMAVSILNGNLKFYDIDNLELDVRKRSLRSNMKYNNTREKM